MSKSYAEYKITDEEEQYYNVARTAFKILAPLYDTGTAFISSLRNKVAELVEAGNGAEILDVATGTGQQAFAFARKGLDVIGIDASKDMLRIAIRKNRHDNVRFEIADAASLPFEDNSFDVSVVSLALHDMVCSIREKALKEMVRVTKPNGAIIIVDYALPKNRIRRSVFYNIVRLYEPYYPEFIKSDIEATLRKSGVEIEKRLLALFGAVRILKGRKIDGVANLQRTNLGEVKTVYD